MPCRHGQNAVFAQTALQAFDTQKTLAFFQSLGLITTVEPSGKVYPLSDQAGSVVDVLRLALEEMGVEIRTSFEVTALKRGKKGGFLEKQEAARLQKAALVVIGRPTQEEGYSVEEAWNLVLESLYAKGGAVE